MEAGRRSRLEGHARRELAVLFGGFADELESTRGLVMLLRWREVPDEDSPHTCSSYFSLCFALIPEPLHRWQGHQEKGQE